jgi:hypothetical protein
MNFASVVQIRRQYISISGMPQKSTGIQNGLESGLLSSAENAASPGCA